jgi:hypothetical protein
VTRHTDPPGHPLSTCHAVEVDEPEDRVERTGRAVALVMRDVEAVLGPDALTVLIGTPKDMRDQLRARGLPKWELDDLQGWIIDDNGGAIGIWFPEDDTLEDDVVRVADVVQEGAIEGSRHWGARFPPCPAHLKHPMNAGLAAGVPSGTCSSGSGASVPIGAFDRADA